MKLAIPALLLATATAAADCPKPVTDAIAKAFPKAKVDACKPEGANFEARLTKADGARIEVDVAADGKILQIEEAIPLDKVPAAVMKAFAARYPKASKPTRAEKQSGGATTSYELAFSDGSATKEATFTEDGKFVEEE
jgi:uncharacterized membrane protein YkoI